MGKPEPAEKIQKSRSDGGLSPNYTGFFDRFNRGEFFEAHDVLEELWLQVRGTPNGAFYKGLIQLAGAFVHVQKGRQGPALALLRLAESNLAGYGDLHDNLDVKATLGRIREWKQKVATTAEQMSSPRELGVELHLTSD